MKFRERRAAWPRWASLGALFGVLLAALTAFGASAGCSDIVLSQAADAGAEGGLDASYEDVILSPPVTCDPSLPPSAAPSELGCTGLYSDWRRHAVAPTAREYRPTYEYWTDGADKTRWIQLPAGQTIDTSDMNEWSFPVGTKIWQEFRLPVGGKSRKVETRMMSKTDAAMWLKVTYRWSADETTATELKEGALAVFGTPYAIPTSTDCNTCHQGRKDQVLGFEAIQLAGLSADGLIYAQLQSEGRLSSNVVSANQLQLPGTTAEQEAIGYLHVNCGVSCHSGSAAWTASASGLVMRVAVDAASARVPPSVMALAPAQNTVGKRLAEFVPPAGAGLSNCRILPGSSAKSVLLWRTAQRDATAGAGRQMPLFVASHQVDPQGEATLKAWIDGMTAANSGYPAPPPSGTCP